MYKTSTKVQNSTQKFNLDKLKFSCIAISKKLRGLWIKPETIVIIFLILTRIFLILFTQWPMDFDWYVEIAERVFAGEKIYADFQTTHMPLTDLIYILMYLLCPLKTNPILLRFFMKSPFLLSDIGIAIAVMKIIEYELLKNESIEDSLHKNLEQKRISKAKLIAGYFVAFSIPLILQTGGGRYDSLMIFCFTMVVYYIQRNNWFGIAFFAALGTSVKYIGVIFLPFVIVWMKKEDLKPFILGLLLGFLPIYPFLVICPEEFIYGFFQRAEHIAYGFSIWHAIMIAWSGFTLYYVSGITDTYNISNEPWFVSELYLYFFFALYVAIFIIYFIKNRQKIKTEELDQQSLLYQLNLVFIPLFIFALTFKAINIQVLAWFTPFIALLRKTDLLIEYSLLTFLNGLGLIIFESFNPTAFASFVAPIAAEGSIMNILVIKPVLYIQSVTTETVWVGLVFFTIIWYLLRTTFELIINTKKIMGINS